MTLLLVGEDCYVALLPSFLQGKQTWQHLVWVQPHNSLASATFLSNLSVFLLCWVAKLATVLWMWFQVLKKREIPFP